MIVTLQEVIATNDSFQTPHFWLLVRVTFVVALIFCPKILGAGRWQGPTNNPFACKKIELCALSGSGGQKLCNFPYLPSASASAPYEQAGETFIT